MWQIFERDGFPKQNSMWNTDICNLIIHVLLCKNEAIV